MKIGIISINMYSKGLNFACPLHTYAFQQFLLKNGIESTVINYKPVYFDDFDLRHPYVYYENRMKKFEKKKVKTEKEEEVRQQKIRINKERVENLLAMKEAREIRYDKFQKFIDDNYIKTEFCYNSDLLEVMDPGFDCYICATDVLWKNEPGFGFDRGFFLASTCMDNKWKIAYAGSRNSRVAKTPEENKQFFQYLEGMDKISVREASLKEFIEENSDLNATLVVDPVLLHERDFYDKIMVKPKEEHYLLLYYVMEKAEDTLGQAVKYARAHNLKIVELTERFEKKGRLQKYEDVETIYRYDVGIEEWLGYIQYADCVFTNSFHACCFCALFEKKFFAGQRHGDKVSNVLEMLGLTDRRFDEKTDLINHEPPETDFTEVRKKLAMWRESSGKYILDAIHEAEKSQKEIKDYSADKKKLTYKIFYNSGKSEEAITWNYTGATGIVKKMASGSFEFQPNKKTGVNNGETKLKVNGFYRPGYKFKGWKLRFRIDNFWCLCLSDGTVCPKSEYDETKYAPVKIFKDKETIPYLPVNKIAIVVADAVWEKSEDVK